MTDTAYWKPVWRNRAGQPAAVAALLIRFTQRASLRGLVTDRLRFSLRLLHVRAHDLPAEGRPADAGGARTFYAGAFIGRGAQSLAPDRRRATCPARDIMTLVSPPVAPPPSTAANLDELTLEDQRLSAA